jgi:hypothetical protein
MYNMEILSSLGMEGKQLLIVSAEFDLFLYVTSFRPSALVLKTNLNMTMITDNFGIRVSQATCRPRIPRRTYNCRYETSRGRRGSLVLPTPRPSLASLGRTLPAFS